MDRRHHSFDADPDLIFGSSSDPSLSFTQTGKSEEKFFTAMPVYIVLPFSSVSEAVTLFVILENYLNFLKTLVFSLRLR